MKPKHYVIEARRYEVLLKAHQEMEKYFEELKNNVGTTKETPLPRLPAISQWLLIGTGKVTPLSEFLKDKLN